MHPTTYTDNRRKMHPTTCTDNCRKMQPTIRTGNRRKMQPTTCTDNRRKYTQTTCIHIFTRLYSLFRLLPRTSSVTPRLPIDELRSVIFFDNPHTHISTLRNTTSFPPDSDLPSQQKSLRASLTKLYTRMHKCFCSGNGAHPLNRGPCDTSDLVKCHRVLQKHKSTVLKHRFVFILFIYMLDYEQFL
jgi:hypothetical protein